ncbi:POLQ (predicted) [Pycnogonum litorale]
MRKLTSSWKQQKCVKVQPSVTKNDNGNGSTRKTRQSLRLRNKKYGESSEHQNEDYIVSSSKANKDANDDEFNFCDSFDQAILAQLEDLEEKQLLEREIDSNFRCTTGECTPTKLANVDKHLSDEVERFKRGNKPSSDHVTSKRLRDGPDKVKLHDESNRPRKKVLNKENNEFQTFTNLNLEDEETGTASNDEFKSEKGKTTNHDSGIDLKIRTSTDVTCLMECNQAQKNKSSSSSNRMKRNSDIRLDRRQCKETAKRTSLSNWNIPDVIVKCYNDVGIFEMYEWQAECLSTSNVLDGGNLVYSAPTSAGKTMVAEILMLKTVLERKKKAIMILPFVSVVREKMITLQKLFQESGIKVDGYMGNHNPIGGFNSVDIAICTIEKANSLVNRLLEESQLHQLGLLAVDELHMVGDSHRGYLLELLLTKVRYASLTSCDTSSNSIDVQILGMSATLPNLSTLARWLNAELYRTDYRPVPLIELVKVGNAIYDAAGTNKLREIDNQGISFTNDGDHTIFLSLKTVAQGHGVLIFCPTKNWCEKMAEMIAAEFYKIGKPGNVFEKINEAASEYSKRLRNVLSADKIRDVFEQLKTCPVGVDTILAKTVPFGVAFHHAGLTFEERDIIEGGFRNGIIKVLVATSTLSSGVNLPARLVIIRSPMFHGKLIDPLAYKQMVGRAGRKGIDDKGESILLCKEQELTKVQQLVKSDLKAVRSCLVLPGQSLSSSLKRAILEIIVSGIATSLSEVEKYVSCTLLSKDGGDREEFVDVDSCIGFLNDSELIRIETSNDESDIKYVASQFGRAVLSSSLSPDEGLRVFDELQRARRSFVLENDLHIVYQVTPIYVADQWDAVIDWYHYMSLWEGLSADMKRVGELVGVEERFLVKAIRGRVNRAVPKQAQARAVHLRFYTALALNDLVNEVPLNEVCRKYGCNRGVLQSLQQSAATFAGMVTVFCNRLGWSNMELLLTHYQNRLNFGIQRELCDLVRISLLNGQRARSLYDAGYETVARIAKASSSEILAVLKNSLPFQSSKQGEDETARETARRNQTRRIWLTGQRGLAERDAAELIISEARTITKKEIGVDDIAWNETKPDSEEISSRTSGIRREILNDSCQRDDAAIEESPIQCREDVKGENVSDVKVNNELISNEYTSKQIDVTGNRDSSGDSLVDLNMSLDEISETPAFPSVQRHGISGSSDTREDSHSAHSEEVENAECLSPSPPRDGQESVAEESQRDAAAKSDIVPCCSSFILNVLKCQENRHSPGTLIVGEKMKFVDEKYRLSTSVNDLSRSMWNTSESCEIFYGDEDARRNLGEDSGTVIKDGSSGIKRRSRDLSFMDSLTIDSETADLIDGRESKDEANCDDVKSSRSVRNKRINDRTKADESTFSENETSNYEQNNSIEMFSDVSIERKCLRSVENMAMNDLSDFGMEILQILDDDSINVTLKADRSASLSFIESSLDDGKRFSSDFIPPTPEKQDTFQKKSLLKFNNCDVARISDKSFKRIIGDRVDDISPTDDIDFVDATDDEEAIKSLVVEFGKSSEFSVGMLTESREENGRVETEKCKTAATIGVFLCLNGTKVYFVPSDEERRDSDVRSESNLMTFWQVFRSKLISVDSLMILLDAKRQLKCLMETFDVKIDVKLMDPKIAFWLLDPDSEEKDTREMVREYCPSIMHLLESGRRSNYLAEGAIESLIAYRLMKTLRPLLKNNGLIESFVNVEMPSVVTFVSMERNGLGFSVDRSNGVKRILKSKLEKLETEAFKLAGRKFNLSSSVEVGKVLYKELRIEVPGDENDENRKCGPTTRGEFSNKIVKLLGGKSRNRNRYSTSKQTLVELKLAHRLPGIILDWRKTSCTLKKVLYALERCRRFDPLTKMDRIYGSVLVHTSTGRISMNEPNLQNIAKDFVFNAEQDDLDRNTVISLRKLFVPCAGKR